MVECTQQADCHKIAVNKLNFRHNAHIIYACVEHPLGNMELEQIDWVVTPIKPIYRAKFHNPAGSITSTKYYDGCYINFTDRIKNSAGIIFIYHECDKHFVLLELTHEPM